MALNLTDEELIELFDVRLPELLERRPELEPRIYHAFMRVPVIFLHPLARAGLQTTPDAARPATM